MVGALLFFGSMVTMGYLSSTSPPMGHAAERGVRSAARADRLGVRYVGSLRSAESAGAAVCRPASTNSVNVYRSAACGHVAYPLAQLAHAHVESLEKACKRRNIRHEIGSSRSTCAWGPWPWSRTPAGFVKWRRARS